jgi:hypothetical protein
MDTKLPKEKLRELIQGSMFLAKDVKESLLSNFDSLTEQDLSEIEELFIEAENKQSELIDKIVEFDETFLPRLRQFKKSEIRKYQKQVEEGERKVEKPEQILNKMS